MLKRTLSTVLMLTSFNVLSEGIEVESTKALEWKQTNKCAYEAPTVWNLSDGNTLKWTTIMFAEKGSIHIILGAALGENHDASNLKNLPEQYGYVTIDNELFSMNYKVGESSAVFNFSESSYTFSKLTSELLDNKHPVLVELPSGDLVNISSKGFNKAFSQIFNDCISKQI